MDRIDRKQIPSTQEQEVSEKEEKITVGKAERRTQSQLEVKDNRSLALETREILHPILNVSDWDTFKQLRQVSMVFYKTSITMWNGLSPLMGKAFFTFDLNELFKVEAKPIKAAEIEEAPAPESGQSIEPKIEYTSIEVNEIYENLGITDFEKTQASFSITIKNDEELKAFAELIQSDKLSSEQKAILSKIKKINFEIYVENSNITDVNTVLNYFGTEERASKLTNLVFRAIGVPLTLPQFPNLTNLSFEDIFDTLTLPEFLSLTELHIKRINYDLTLPQFPNLRKLSFFYIDPDNVLSLKELPNLTHLSFHWIRRPVILPLLPNLTRLSFGSIMGGLELPELPNLTNLSISQLYGSFVMPYQPNLQKVSCQVPNDEAKSKLPEQLKNNAITREERERKEGYDLSKEVTPSIIVDKLINFFKILGFSLLLLAFISRVIKNIS
ncbi:MAG: hypothetical protein C5B43_00060 [Verrucomicrobia bacterium]|nr:MAG: hypothetical protein C5B43_00060 [Verrucomicrobiota bacterium]